MLSNEVRTDISQSRIVILAASLVVLLFCGSPQLAIWTRNLGIVVAGVLLLMTFIKGDKERVGPCPFGYTYTDLLNQLVIVGVWVLVGMLVYCPQVLGFTF